MFENIKIEFDFENEVKKIKIFERFPDLIPYAHENYKENQIHSQTLIVGESNYFDATLSNISCFQNAKMWYLDNNPIKELVPDCNISNGKSLKEAINNDGKISAPQLRGLYKSLAKILNRNPKDDDIYYNVAFYNYFLRPAYNCNDGKGNGFGRKGYYQDLDGKVAFATFSEIIKVLKPNLVIFASKYTFDKMEEFRKEGDFENIEITRVAHPSCKWWSISGRNEFEDLLIEHWIKEKPAYYHNFEKLRYIHQQLKQIFNVEKEPKCFHSHNEKGDFYLSKLDFHLKNYDFYCQTEIEKNNSIYYTYFYDKSSIIPPQSILKANNFEFAPDTKNEVVIAEIEKLIRKVIEELS